MKVSNTLVTNASIKQLQNNILLCTKEQYTKVSNSLAGNAIIKQLYSQILLNIKAQYMSVILFQTVWKTIHLKIKFIQHQRTVKYDINFAVHEKYHLKLNILVLQAVFLETNWFLKQSFW